MARRTVLRIGEKNRCKSLASFLADCVVLFTAFGSRSDTPCSGPNLIWSASPAFEFDPALVPAKNSRKSNVILTESPDRGMETTLTVGSEAHLTGCCLFAIFPARTPAPPFSCEGGRCAACLVSPLLTATCDIVPSKFPLYSAFLAS